MIKLIAVLNLCSLYAYNGINYLKFTPRVPELFQRGYEHWLKTETQRTWSAAPRPTIQNDPCLGAVMIITSETKVRSVGLKSALMLWQPQQNFIIHVQPLVPTRHRGRTVLLLRS